MPRFSRDTEGTLNEIVSLEPPFSNFAYLDEHFPYMAPLGRILSQVRQHGGSTMVVETLDAGQAEDTATENEDIATAAGDLSSSRLVRLTFFKKAFTTIRGLLNISEDQFLGYAITKHDELVSGQQVNRVFESVLSPSRHANNYIHGNQNWRCSVAGEPLPVSGYLYAQQNNITNVCAHVACRTAAARYHPDGDMTYRQMNSLPEIAVDHVQRKVGGGLGLTVQDLATIMKAAGASCFLGDYTVEMPNIDRPPFQKYVYGSIESGFPALLCFATNGGQHHAIPVFGHTFNEDTWVPSAEQSYFRVGAGTEYIPSDSWLSTYIAHDDNWGSNYCIPRHFLYSRRMCSVWPSGSRFCELEDERVAYVVATLPGTVQVGSLKAELVGADFLYSILPQLPEQDSPWTTRLKQLAAQRRLVLRTILINSSEYVRHLAKMRDWEGRAVNSRLVGALKNLPDQQVWMIEVSVPELFQANRRKLGEILMKAESPLSGDRSIDSFLFARTPAHLAFHSGGASPPTFDFIRSGLQSHVSLFYCDD